MGRWILLCPTDCAPLEGDCSYTGGHGKPFVLRCKKGLKSVSVEKTQKMLNTKLPKRGTGLKLDRTGKRRKGKPRTLKQREKRHSMLALK